MSLKAPSRGTEQLGLSAGVDSEHHQMLFIAPSREAKRQVRVPMSALQHGRLTLRTDLVDVYLYIFTKQTVFAVLEARPSCQSIKQVRSTDVTLSVEPDLPRQVRPAHRAVPHQHCLCGLPPLFCLMTCTCQTILCLDAPIAVHHASVILQVSVVQAVDHGQEHMLELPEGVVRLCML